jgi:hypothetical protein
MDATGNRAMAAGYDSVVVPGPNGSSRSLSRREFEALPLRERVGFLIEGKARFFRKGAPIAAAEAMKG